MEKVRKLFMLFACVCLSMITLMVHAQTKTITGTVKDEKGNPLSDVMVVVKGTSVQTLTSETGAFSLDISTSAQSLEFSRVGYATQEVAISSESAGGGGII